MRSRALTLAGLLLLAAALRLPTIGAQSLWVDEAHTVWLTHWSLGHMLGLIAHTETTPPAYFVAAWLWTHFAGNTAAALRTLSALAGIATVPAMLSLGTRLAGRRVGVLAAGLTACSPFLVWYAQEARSYALFTLLTVLLLRAFLEADREPRSRWTAGWATLAVLALATHYDAGLLVGPMAGWLLLRHRRAVWIAAATVVTATALLGLLALRQLDTLQTAGWLSHLSLGGRVLDTVRTFAIGPVSPAAPLVLGGIAAAVAIAGATLARDRSGRRVARPPAGLVVAGTALMGALLAVGVDELDPRNMIELWPPVALLVAVGLAGRPLDRLRGAAVAVLLGCLLVPVIGVATEHRLQRPDWRGLAEVLGGRPARAVMLVDYCQTLPLALYLPGVDWVAGATVPVRELDVVVATGQHDWRTAMTTGGFLVCHPSRGSLAGVATLPGFRRAGTTRLDHWRILRWHSDLPRPVTVAGLRRIGLTGALLGTPATAR